MTTLLEDSFRQRCHVSDGVDYGYEDATPETLNDNSYGYGDGPDNKYGYGDGSPTGADAYGYGRESPGGNDATKYGYGDASPNDDAAKYGYGDAPPNDAAKYGYGDSAPEDGAKYGYGDAPPSDSAANYGYGEASPDEGGSNPESQPSRRPRRRNSVTRYSIVAQDAVITEFVAHANVIDQFRQGLNSGAAPPAAQGDEVVSIPLRNAPSRGVSTRGIAVGSGHDGSSFDGNSVDGVSDDGTDIAGDKKDTTKKRRGLGRFLIGRNSSHTSKDSTRSK
jgi:hypothetical protein